MAKPVIPTAMDSKDSQIIEQSLCLCLQEVLENCHMDLPGLTKHSYQKYGEVFNLTTGGKVHILPGMEEIITVSRGASIFALTRSHATPARIHYIWKLTIKKSGHGPIKYTKAHHIHEDTEFVIPVFQLPVGKELSALASDVIAQYTSARLRWRNGMAVESSIKLAINDLVGPQPGVSGPVRLEPEPKATEPDPSRSVPTLDLEN